MRPNRAPKKYESRLLMMGLGALQYAKSKQEQGAATEYKLEIPHSPALEPAGDLGYAAPHHATDSLS